MICKGSDVQNSAQTAIFSSGYGSAGGILLTQENLDRAAVVFTVRRLIGNTWINNRDQFLTPAGNLSAKFKSDCLIWMFFSTVNSPVAADGIKWAGKNWSLDNNFHPFSETEVGAPGQFKSDFMSKKISELTLSPEAKSLMREGRTLWRAYFEGTNEHATRTKYKLGRPDVGWYQVRSALVARNRAGNGKPISFRVLSLLGSHTILNLCELEGCE